MHREHQKRDDHNLQELAKLRHQVALLKRKHKYAKEKLKRNKKAKQKLEKKMELHESVLQDFAKSDEEATSNEMTGISEIQQCEDTKTLPSHVSDEPLNFHTNNSIPRTRMIYRSYTH